MAEWLKIANFTIITSAFTHTTAAGALTVTGLPVTVGASATSMRGALQWGGITKANYTSFAPRGVSGATTIVFSASGSGQAVTSIGSGDVPTGGTLELVGSVIYSA